MTESLYIYLLSICIVTLQCVDFRTTWVALGNGGVELNPLMSFLFDKFGTRLGLFVGKFFVGAFVICGAFLGIFTGGLGNACLFIIAITYLLVAIHNTMLVKKIGK